MTKEQENPLEVDVLVIGGGPAGAACATVLSSRRARVAIVEASNFTQFRVGETIEPSVRSLLARLGISIGDNSNWALPSDSVASCWGQSISRKRPAILNPYGRGWRVERQLFDRELFENAGLAGAALFKRASVDEVRRHAGWWEFAITSDEIRVQGRAPFVVEATGRNKASRFAPKSSRLWLDQLIGISMLNECSDQPMPVSALIEATPYGWWYSVCLPKGRTLAIFFTDGDLLPRGKTEIASFLRQQIKDSEITGDRCSFIEQSVERHLWKTFDARSSIRRTAVSDGWVATGDALMAFDPLCGRGVTEAMNSGIEVAEWLLNRQASDSKSIPAWVEQVSARFNDYLEQRRRTYSYENRWNDSPFWRRRHPY